MTLPIHKAPTLNKSSFITLLFVFLALWTFLSPIVLSAPIMGNETYTGSGDLSGMTWAAIQDRFASNYYASRQGWNQTQTFVNNSKTILWAPWYTNGDSLTESNLKDTYTQNLNSTNATWEYNTAVTDEYSELSMASAMNWTGTSVQQFINYLDACSDTTAAHVSEGPWLTSWICTRNGTSIVKNDENSASDATARYALTLYMAAKSPNLNATMKNLALERANNITRAGLAEEWVSSCQNSTVNTSTQLCNWHLAGAAQAWGGGALTQSGQQMFFGYHESNIMSYLAAYAATGEEKYSSAARNETHQFLFVVGFRNQGNTSGDFNYTTGGASYYLNCSTNPCKTATTSTSDSMDDSDATRLWETCNNVEYADTTYTTRGESLPWEFVALKRYCQAWTTRAGPTGLVTVGGVNFANTTSACYRIRNDSTCDDTGIVGLNSFKPAGWVSNIVARTNNATYYNTFAAGSLSTYDTGLDVYPGQTAFGVYGSVRYLRSIRAATGYYDFIFENATYNYTAYAMGNGSGGSPASSVGGLNITLNSPLNNSWFNVSFVVLNVTVWNNNNTDVTTGGGAGYATIAQCGFTSATDTCNASGGTLNTTTGMYEDTANSQVWTFGPFNQTNHTWFNITVWANLTNATNFKVYPEENTTSSAGDHYLFDISSGKLRVRNEPGYSKSCTGLDNRTMLMLSFIVNRSSNEYFFVTAGCSWGINMTLLNNASADYLRVEVGQSKGLERFDNITVQVPASETSTTVAGNSTMNVTFSYENGTVIYAATGVTNATSVSFNLSGLTNGTYTWLVNAISKDNNSTLSPLLFEINTSEPYVPPTPTPEEPSDLTSVERLLFILMGTIAAVGTFVMSEDLSLTAIVGVTFFIIILASIL